MQNDLIHTSKFLSLVLRHEPQSIGLRLDPEGWADMGELIACAGKHRMQLTRELIEKVVRTSDKKRFALSPDGLKIRANQGHSVQVDLKLEPRTPPEILYHGTATRFIDSIKEKGLISGERQHVHLSPDEKTALKVGQRHGKPVILKVKAGELQRAGGVFYCSENGVWLTEKVAPVYLEFP